LGPVVHFAIGLLAVGALAAATVPFAGSSGSSPPSSFASASTDQDGSTTEPDNQTSTGSEDGIDTESGGTVTDEQSTPTPLAGSPNSPARVLRRHFQRLSSGDFESAFALMTPAYRDANPGWLSARQAARPYVNITEIGEVDFKGGGVASVPVKFYGHDQYDTKDSDTICRRFEGVAGMRKVDGLWRYNPAGNSYTVAKLPPDLDACNP